MCLQINPGGRETLTDRQLVTRHGGKRSSDSVATIVCDFYRAFDNRDARIPDANLLRVLFARQALIWRMEGGRCEVLNLEEFIQPRMTLLRSGKLCEFHEWEVWGETLALGNMASHWSRYEKRGTLDGRPVRGRGRKLLHFCRGETGWLITGLLWEDDAES